MPFLIRYYSYFNSHLFFHDSFFPLVVCVSGAVLPLCLVFYSAFLCLGGGLMLSFLHSLFVVTKLHPSSLFAFGFSVWRGFWDSSSPGSLIYCLLQSSFGQVLSHNAQLCQQLTVLLVIPVFGILASNRFTTV